MKAKDFISESIIYEAYFNLYGLPFEYVKMIQERLLNFSSPRKGDECEAYTCDACMAVRFRSTSQRRIGCAKTLFQKLMAKALPEYSSECYYVNG